MKRHILIILIILLIGLFFRTYQIVERFEFAHDSDLYSWIVKDILINHHFRLIGQLTSAPGIFIGPMFYYLITPFFLLTKMDPIGVVIPITILGLLTIFSYYFVLSKIFTKEVGLIGAYLYAILIATVSLDRWVVPTVTTSFWSIWYLYTLLMIIQGKFYVFPLLGILIGLIWHIHIALLPTLIAVPFAIFASKRTINIKQILILVLAFFIISTPLIAFELKHNFSQSLSFINNFTYHPEGSPTGFYRLQVVLGVIIKNLNLLLFAPSSFYITNNILFTLIVLLSPLLLIKRRIISLKQLIPVYSWILGLILFFSLSSSLLSEYYFSSLNVIFITFASLYFYFFLKHSKRSRLIILLILSMLLVKNLFFMINQDYYKKGYAEKKAVVDYINNDASKKGFPCIGINYITSPGENTGFRYLIFLKKIHIAPPQTQVPVYNIVIPYEYSIKEIDNKFGNIGIILPKKIPTKENMEKDCSGGNINLSDSLFGYVE